jgi:hypothetical protein
MLPVPFLSNHPLARALLFVGVRGIAGHALMGAACWVHEQRVVLLARLRAFRGTRSVPPSDDGPLTQGDPSC